MNDLISRHAAIDALGDEPEVWTGKDEYAQGLNNQWHYDRNAIKAVPSAQPEQQWIPCKTRLPKENDYRGCMECIDGAVWYLTDKGTIGLGYYYDSTKEWSTTDDLKPYGNVIAWCRIPEPWRGEEQ